MKHFYTNDRNHQIIISLLKAHGIRRVIASPGIANSVFIGSLQNDSFFKIYSAVDERSAAYMACGLAFETGEPVVISCTGATASRNYMPGLTEAYYSKLPILVVTSSQPSCRVGHLVPQVTDRSAVPNDIVNLSVTLPTINTSEEEWACEVQANRAILELRRHGGGPVHINLITAYGYNPVSALTCRELPPCRKIDRVTSSDVWPELPEGRVGIFVGLHRRWTPELTSLVDAFCEKHNAVVFCDHTSNYKGKYAVYFALAINQFPLIKKKQPAFEVDLLLHMGEISGEEGAPSMISGRETWRISADGELRDTFRNLTHVFEMDESLFFAHYESETGGVNEYYAECRSLTDHLQRDYRGLCLDSSEVPLSNVWLAAKIAPHIPLGSRVVLAILNTLRTWNYAAFSKGVDVFCPVGGFGIDGATSCALGISLNTPDNLCYVVTGDLAFFYDLNSLGNRHVSRNLRILLINNGCGVEFKKTYSTAYKLLGEEVDPYVAAAGHFGAKSEKLVKGFAEALGFSYISASTKEEVEDALPLFTSTGAETPILFEVFVRDSDERDALDIIHHRFK